MGAERPNRTDASLARELRKDLMGKHAFAPFPKTDFYDTACLFWKNGYFSIATIRGMGSRERDLFLAQVKKDHCGRSILSDLRLTLKIFAWFESQKRMRDGGQHSFEEVDIDKRMRCWTTDLSGLAGILAPDQATANHFSAELEREAGLRAPHTSLCQDGLAR